MISARAKAALAAAKRRGVKLGGAWKADGEGPFGRQCGPAGKSAGAGGADLPTP